MDKSYNAGSSEGKIISDESESNMMLRFFLGVTRMDEIRKEVIRETTQTGRLGEKAREARLRWFGHVRRRDSGYIGRRLPEMELPGRRRRGRPKRRFMDAVR